MLRLRKGMAPRLSEATFCPFTMTEPEVGRSIAGMSLSSVDLPAPERPVRNTSSPASIEKLTSFSASWPPGERFATAKKLTNQRLGELDRHERAQIVDALAHADEKHGHRALLGDGADRAPLRRAVALGDDQAGELERFVECLHLGEGVLPRIGVQDQEHL